MGSSQSSNRQRMNTSEEATSSSQHDLGVDDSPSDLQAILAYLIRNGQVRILTHDDDDDVEEKEDSDDPEFFSEANSPNVDTSPDTAKLEMNDIKQKTLEQSGRAVKRLRVNKPTVVHMIQNREIGTKSQNFTSGDRRIINCQYLPNHGSVVAHYNNKAFCGTYSKDGNIFLTASQDQHIRIYDTTNDQFRRFKTIRARDVGWSVLDTAFSPDGNHVIYSSWSDCIHLCNIYGDFDTHHALHLFPGNQSFAIFSLVFSSDNREILGGANDGCLYVYDRESNQRILKIDAHDDDVNAVAFADDSSHILFSGGDDGLCKVWDRRTLREDNPEPVGTFAGHTDGITFIDSKGDARYLLSNSKDQTMKLWDIRYFSGSEGIEATKKAVARQQWDYRWQQVPKSVSKKRTVLGDSSVMTYRGHSVLHTLIRCHFSPEYLTGQRYVYTGCATGSLVVYDLLTGKIVTKLSGHKSCTRDVSWHSYKNNIMTTSWDGTVCKWDYQHKEDTDTEEPVPQSSDDDDDDTGIFGMKRRSRRLAAKRIPSFKPHICGSSHGLFD